MQPLPGWQSEFGPHFVVVDGRIVASLRVDFKGVLRGPLKFTREKK
jgi:hypothetical protein